MLDFDPTLPRTALVTGGARRLGREIALALGGAGFDIGLHCHTSTGAAEQTAAMIRAGGQRAVVLKADLTDESQLTALIAKAGEALGPIGALVNNAAVFERDEWHNATRTSWDHHMQANLRAPFVLMQEFARALPQTARGVIINMLDQRVLSPTPHFVSYTVSKAGLWTLTQTMAMALAPRIRVCAIGPGATLPSPHQSDAQLAHHNAATPLGYGALPEEVAMAVVMLLTLSAFTGQMLALDGGQHLKWN